MGWSVVDAVVTRATCIDEGPVRRQTTVTAGLCGARRCRARSGARDDRGERRARRTPARVDQFQAGVVRGQLAMVPRGAGTGAAGRTVEGPPERACR